MQMEKITRHRGRHDWKRNLVHGDLGQQEQTLKDRSETEGLISAVVCRSASGKQNSPDLHLTEAHSEWDVRWTPWWSYNECKQIPPELTKDQIAEAKKIELQKFAERGVYEVVDRSEVELNPESVMLSAKWVITNKGTVKYPKPKARLVAREFVSDAIDRDTLFSGTPARSLISRAATLRSSAKKFKIMLLDVTAAFLYGFSERPLFMEIPKEDPASENPRLIARLVRSLYGTRDAPQLWAKHVCGTLRELGYEETKGAPGVFWNPSTGVELVLHVDDFLVVGEEQVLQDLKDKLQAVYELTATIIGGGEADRKEGTYLGRTIRWQEWSGVGGQREAC